MKICLRSQAEPPRLYPEQAVPSPQGSWCQPHCSRQGWKNQLGGFYLSMTTLLPCAKFKTPQQKQCPTYTTMYRAIILLPSSVLTAAGVRGASQADGTPSCHHLDTATSGLLTFLLADIGKPSVNLYWHPKFSFLPPQYFPPVMSSP